MRLGKRGMEDKLTFVMWELIVILMVVIVLTVSVNGLANNTNYWKRYHSTDLALMTDLMYAHQGDFIINYDMKDIRKNFVTKTMQIKPLVFQTLLKENAYFVYDTSVDEDRFPKSYIFGSSTSIDVRPANMTSDYIVIYRAGGEITMKSNEVSKQVTCSAIDTSADVTTKRFGALGLSDQSKGYGTYITGSLKTTGTGLEDELLIAININDQGRMVAYFDTSSESQGQSEKMACLVRKYLSLKYPDTEIAERPLDSSLETDEFKVEREKYFQWVVIDVNASVSKAELDDVITKAINEYYGLRR